MMDGSRDLGGSYVAPDVSPLLRIQMADLERPNFMYVHMFGQHTIKQVSG